MVRSGKPPTEDTERFSVTFDREDADYLRNEAEDLDTTISQIVRRAVRKERLSKQEISLPA